MIEETTFLTVKQFAEKHKFITSGGLRWLLYSNNEFRNICARQLGKKVLLIEKNVIDFIMNDQGNTKMNEGWIRPSQRVPK